jgi:hypothetical protein
MKDYRAILEGTTFTPAEVNNFFLNFNTYAKGWKAQNGTSSTDSVSVVKGAERIAISFLTNTVAISSNGSTKVLPKPTAAIQRVFQKNKLGELEFENGYARMDNAQAKKVEAWVKNVL